MYKIVLAEDEADVRAIIKKRINESETDFQVVGEAEDGLQALELLKELKPDILLTDICMPRLGGLELIRQVIDADFSIQTVIISGHDEFAYAKEAMQMGVRDYLLKPFLPRELFQVLNRIRMSLEKQRQMVQNIKELNQDIEASRRYAKERLLKELLDGAPCTDDRRERGERAGLDMEAAWYAVGIVRFLDKDKGKRVAVEQGVLEELLCVSTENYFSGQVHSAGTGYGNEESVLLFCTREKSEKQFVEDIGKTLVKISDSMEKYYAIKIKCTLGRSCRDISGIAESVREAAEAWKSVLNQGEIVIPYKEAQEEKKEFVLRRPEELEKELLLNIQMDKRSSAIENIDAILRYYADFFSRYTEFVSVSLIQLVLQISDITMKAGGNLKAWEDESIIDFLKKQFMFGSLFDAKAVLEEYVIKCSGQFAQINEKQSDKLVGNIKLLIEQNLGNEEFGLEMAASQLHFSANYIRQIFRQKTGESFTDYLFRQRMELAERMLDNPAYRIQDVAWKTGYSDQRYFSRCFRKYKNCTPTEYRMQRGHGKKESD